jgi:hypothetical protein
MRTPRKNPAADRLVFHIGPFLYTLVISERRIYDPEGNELEGAAIESRRLLMLSFALPVHRREDIAAESTRSIDCRRNTSPALAIRSKTSRARYQRCFCPRRHGSPMPGASAAWGRWPCPGRPRRG